MTEPNTHTCPDTIGYTWKFDSGRNAEGGLIVNCKNENGNSRGVPRSKKMLIAGGCHDPKNCRLSVQVIPSMPSKLKLHDLLSSSLPLSTSFIHSTTPRTIFDPSSICKKTVDSSYSRLQLELQGGRIRGVDCFLTLWRYLRCI